MLCQAGDEGMEDSAFLDGLWDGDHCLPAHAILIGWSQGESLDDAGVGWCHRHLEDHGVMGHDRIEEGLQSGNDSSLDLGIPSYLPIETDSIRHLRDMLPDFDVLPRGGEDTGHDFGMPRW